jgi:hypothetical protein
MKKFLVLSGALALSLGLMSADVGAITHTVALNATVQAGCTANAPTGTPGFSISGTSSTFTTAVTGTTQAPASGTLTFGSLTCTTNGVKVTLASSRLGLYVTGTEGNSLAKRMNYTVAARLNSTAIVTLDTVQGIASKNGQVTLSTSSTNNILVDISFPGTVGELLPNGALTAGTYSDTLTINIDGVTI